MTTPGTALQALSDERKAFEFWYSTNAFDYVRNPIGCRDCGMQWAAWKAAADQALRAPVGAPINQPEAERAAFELAYERITHPGWKHSKDLAWMVWQARATLAATPPSDSSIEQRQTPPTSRKTP